MDIGVPTEIKTAERRIGLTPGAVSELTSLGHNVVIQAGAGAGAGYEDSSYQEVGASVTASAEEVF